MAHSVAQVQLAPTGLKSISSSHFLKRGKKGEKRERGQRRKNWRGETSTLLSLQPQTAPLHSIQFQRWIWKSGKGGGWAVLEKRRHAFLKLDKALLVSLLESYNALLSSMLHFPFLSENDLAWTFPPENVSLTQPICTIAVKYSPYV